MKVLVVSNMYPGLNNEFPQQGVFVKEQFDALKNLLKSNITLYKISGYSVFTKYIKSIFKIIFLIRKEKYDIIHIHYGLSAFFLFFNFIFPSSTKIFLTCHGSDLLSSSFVGRFVKWMSLLLATRCNALICINENIYNIFSSIDCYKFRIACGVDTIRFKPNDSNSDYFVFPGSKHNKIKNFSFFNSIVSKYNSKYDKHSICTMNGLDREQVVLLIQNAKALIMTSIREGSPQSIKEALSCDIPVISTDVGDVSELLESLPGTHVFQESDSLDTIVDKVHKCIMEASCTRLSRRQRIFDRNLSNDSVANQLLEAYNQVIG